MEKKSPHYDLGTIKKVFSSAPSLRITKTALTTAETLGLTLDEVVRVIQGMAREHFFKSMTSLADHRIWQDVYDVPLGEVISFKEK